MFELERIPAGLSKAKNAPLLTGILRGTERECLRVQPDARLALTPHPPGLGSALTHPLITTDFSEALLEFITPPTHSVDDLLASLRIIQRVAIDELGDELLWTSSMPCLLGDDEDIPVARYGRSNNGMMKTIYRVGLGYRYGRAMQTVSGVHYNFSLPDAFFAYMLNEDHSLDDLQTFRDKYYFNLIRNFRRHYWLLVYLFGASPALCSTFVNNREHDLTPLGDGCTLHHPYATSLRMGDLGYQSTAQESLYVCYDSKQSYVSSLCQAITRPHPEYEGIGLKDQHGNYLQLNTSLLQIENEFYNAIRPKRTTRPGETALAALVNRGVEYVEVRCLDINPFDPLGLTREQIYFLDTFLLYCALMPSPPSSPEESALILKNQKRAVNSGRQAGTELEHIYYGKVPLIEWGKDLLHALRPVATLLDNANHGSKHQASIELQWGKLIDSERTPSARLLRELKESGREFPSYILEQSHRHQEELKAMPIPEKEYIRFAELARKSLREQRTLEQNASPPFDEFLANYYQQYKNCKRC